MIDALIDESHRRSRIREDILLVVDRHGALHLSHIAELCGVRPQLVAMALDGREPYFRRDLSPLVLGLLREIPRVRGRLFEITPRGRRVAAALRRARRRAASRVLAGRVPERASPVVRRARSANVD